MLEFTGQQVPPTAAHSTRPPTPGGAYRWQSSEKRNCHTSHFPIAEPAFCLVQCSRLSQPGSRRLHRPGRAWRGGAGRGGLSAHAQAVAASASALTPRVPSACLTTATGPRAYAIHREGPSHCRVRRPGPVRWVGAEGTGGGTPAEEASAARRGARDSARAPAAGGGRWRLRLPGEPASHRSLLAPKCDFFKKSKNVVFINM